VLPTEIWTTSQGHRWVMYMHTNSFGKRFKHEFAGKETGWTKCTKLVHLRIGRLNEVNAIIFIHTKRTFNIASFFSNFSFVNLQPTFTSTSFDWNLFKYFCMQMWIWLQHTHYGWILVRSFSTFISIFGWIWAKTFLAKRPTFKQKKNYLKKSSRLPLEVWMLNHLETCVNVN